MKCSCSLDASPTPTGQFAFDLSDVPIVRRYRAPAPQRSVLRRQSEPAASPGKPETQYASHLLWVGNM